MPHFFARAGTDLREGGAPLGDQIREIEIPIHRRTDVQAEQDPVRKPFDDIAPGGKQRSLAVNNPARGEHQVVQSLSPEVDATCQIDDHVGVRAPPPLP